MKRVDIISKVVGRDSSGKPVGGGISIPMGNYALKSELESLKSMFNDFLEGDDTDSVINRWKDLEAFLNGISEEDPLTSILGNYVPISGYTEIVGEKNFVGGLKVNGSPIYYDTEKKYWKLEGDLLVTGGITMYGNDSDFVPSTIMDAILYDESTLGINANGELYVKGGTGATTMGSLSNVGSWADSVASQDRIMYQAANSSQWVAKNLSDLAVGGVTGNYLPLTGGELSGSLAVTAIQNGYWAGGIRIDGTTEKPPSLAFHIANLAGWRLYMDKNQKLLWENSSNGQGVTSREILHTSNYSSYALPLSGGTIKSAAVPQLTLQGESTDAYITFKTTLNTADSAHLGLVNLPNIGASASFGVSDRIVFPFSGGMYYRNGYNGTNQTIWHAGNDGSGSGLDADLLDGKHYSDIVNGNVASATRIQAYKHDSGENILISGSRTDNTFPRYIYDNGWGLCLRWQEGNGVVHNGTIATLNDNVASATKLQTARTIWGQSFDGTGNVSGDFIAHFVKIYDDNVIEATSNKKLHLNYYATTDMSLCYGGGNVGIGTTSPGAKLHVVGDVNVAKPSTANQASLSFMNTSSDLWQISGRFNKNNSAENDRLNFYYYNGTTWSNIMTLYNNGNMFVSGGITMYSARKLKNITDERGLSLEELSVIKPTRFTWKDGRDNKIHIGGIADDVMKVLPEVIYKADNDTLTMDYGNAAFAIAASLIKPVVNHEERIRLLEEENKRLKEEVEQLKWNVA